MPRQEIPEGIVRKQRQPFHKQEEHDAGKGEKRYKGHARQQPPANESRRIATEEIIDWLSDYLKDSPAPFAQIREAAKAEGYTAAQLRNAKDRSDGRIATRKDLNNHQRGAASLWYVAVEQ